MSWTVHPRSPTPIAAVLGGKLGKVKKSEDLLTAIVFGALAWIPVSLGIRPMLALMTPAPVWLDQIQRVDVELWPWWTDGEESSGAEPDVVLTLHRSIGLPILLVVECKRGSGLGRRQLARQAKNGLAVESQRKLDFQGLIYLTEHLGPPLDDLERSRQEIYEDVDQHIPVRWISWRDLGPILDRAASELQATSPPVAALAQDAVGVLNRWGLVRYQGIAVPKKVPAWRFISEEQS